MQLSGILFISSIIVALISHKNIKNRIIHEKPFNGAFYGLINGLLGIGIIWVVIMHESINKYIDSIKDKEYKEYTKKEMGDFSKIYGVCFAVLVLLIILTSTYF